MAAGPVFPAFLRLEHQRDNSAKSSFLAEVDATLSSAEQRFKSFSNEAARQLDAALSVRRNDVGSLDLGVADMRAAALAQQARAAAAREIAVATAAAAREQQDYSQKTRLAIAATEALAREEADAAAKALAHADALEQVQAQLNKTASSTDLVIASNRRGTTETGNVINGIRAQRVAFMQFGQQLQDVVVQTQMGITSMTTIFVQQVPQMAFALSGLRESSNSTYRSIGNFATFLAGPWGAAIFGATALLGPFIASLFAAGDASDKVRASSFALNDAQKSLGGIFDLTTGKMRVQTDAAIALAKAQIILAQATARKNLAEANSTIGQSRDPSFLQNFIALGSTPRVAGATPGKPYLPAQSALQQFTSGVADASATIESLRKLRDAGRLSEDQFSKLAVAVANSAVETRNLKDLDTAYSSILSGKLAPGLREAEKSHRSRTQAISEAEKYAKELAKAEAEMALAIERANYAFDKRMSSLNAGSLAPGLLGFTPEKVKTVADGLENLANQAAQITEKAFGGWNTALDGTIERLARIGGAGDALVAIGQLASGKQVNVRGPGGFLAQTVANIPVASNDNGIVTLGDRIEGIFKERGAFGQTMRSILDGAGTGLSLSSVVFGQNNAGSQIGGSIGGALGKIAGEEIGKKVGGTLGKALGPLGSIAGSLLGGALGGLFTSRPRGSGTVTQDGVTTSANNGSVKATLDSFGLGLQQAITKIATQLGGRVGTYDVGIGSYKGGFYQVASSGSDPLLGSAQYSAKSSQAIYDGLDATAALRAAISNAIQDGAIQGVRASTQALLKSGKDIEAQLSKAISFEGVFTKLKEKTDPVGAALDSLNKQFSDLKDIFKEAGASAAEYADLEKLYGIERARAIKTAFDQVAGSLKSLLDDLGVNNSALSLRDRQSAAMAALNPLMARVQAGDTSAFEEFDKAARTALDINRQLYGSQDAYFALENQIRSVTKAALDQQQALADAATSKDSPFSTSGSVSDNANVTAAINAQTDALVSIMTAVNDNLVAALARGAVVNGPAMSAAAGYW